MNRKQVLWTAGIGCAAGCFALILAIALILGLSLAIPQMATRTGVPAPDSEIAVVRAAPTNAVEPRVDAPRATAQTPIAAAAVEVPAGSLSPLYDRLNPGVVFVGVVVERQGQRGQGSGSGFILDNEGHIVTNNHVIADATKVTVVFYDGNESKAEIVGADDDSDLAVIRVDTLADGAHPLPLGDSDQVLPGEWVVAIGSPFGLGSSMTAGIVSAVGRTIPSGVTSFSIPQAIQTDAAVNPGNSGGPLLNLEGEVIGVNAQIAGGSGGANAGVGFAIPSSIVRRVAPELIANGAYEWPWLGIQGGSVNLLIMEANDLPTQQGAYVDVVTPGGPAEAAGLQGSSGRLEIDGLPIATGGDVVIEIDGVPVTDFGELLVSVAMNTPGDDVELTILRDGERRRISVTLGRRPSSLQP
jgi:S1-C subfamily serine protease